jgi:hypothetical protein
LVSVEQYAWINPKVPTNQSDNNDSANAETAGTAWDAAGCARFAVVFNIAAGTKIIGAH